MESKAMIELSLSHAYLGQALMMVDLQRRDEANSAVQGSQSPENPGTLLLTPAAVPTSSCATLRVPPGVATGDLLPLFELDGITPLQDDKKFSENGQPNAIRHVVARVVEHPIFHRRGCHLFIRVGWHERHH